MVLAPVQQMVDAGADRGVVGRAGFVNAEWLSDFENQSASRVIGRL